MNSNIQSSTKTLHISWQDSVCVVDFHDETKSTNAFSEAILSDLDTVVSQALTTPGIVGLVITSTKQGCFAAGVDISIFDTLTTQAAGEQASLKLHALFEKSTPRVA